MFVKAMRLPVGRSGLYSVGTPYQGSGNDKAPYSLCERNALFDGVTQVDAAQGLLNAAVAKADEVKGAHLLEAMYLRKSSAEELR